MHICMYVVQLKWERYNSVVQVRIVKDRNIIELGNTKG